MPDDRLVPLSMTGDLAPAPRRPSLQVFRGGLPPVEPGFDSPAGEDERAMNARDLRSMAGPVALVCSVGSALVLTGWIRPSRAWSQPVQQQQPGATAPGPAGAGQPGRSDDEKAIRAVDDAFVRDYNGGDSKALAALFTDDAESIESQGDRFQGRELIERRFAETFAASPGVQIAIEIGSIRFLSPDVAKEEGHTVVTPVKEAQQVRPYIVLFVKRHGRWLISSVREGSVPLIRPHDRLRDLEWMVGDWVDQAPDSEVRINCRWSEDGNFLIRSFTVKHRGKPVMTVTQRIGWDPLARRIRSWEFDSEGGYGEGTWSRDGDRWVAKHTGVRPEGVAASSTNVMVKERSDLVRWSSTDRVLGDASIPGSSSYVLVRVPPPPRTPTSGPAATPSSPSPTRSR
jgi:uncharacterized protein (TIGR02246 family)